VGNAPWQGTPEKPMKLDAVCARIACALALLLAITVSALAQSYPEEGTWIAGDFKFHTGEVMPELRLAYRTVGEPSGEPVIVLHGTSGSSASMLTANFAGELFGPGQALDATKYFIVLPDGIGHGKSSKPSDGMRAKFPRYNYDDMVLAQYRLVTEGLGLKRARLVIGNSMGGMHAWLWAGAYPDFMDAVVPMASQPTEMSSRNWMMRRMIIDAVRNDPAWKGGDYTEQPQAFRIANVFFGIATIGGTLAYQKQAPTRRPPTSCSSSAMRPRPRRTPTTSSTTGTPRATTTPRRGWSASRRRCSPSMRPMMSATRPRPASWSAS
jgi:homoserine O-acetyltransferase